MNPRNQWLSRMWSGLLGTAVLLGGISAAFAEDPPVEQLPPLEAVPDTSACLAGESKSRISDDVIGIQPVPDRPPLVFEKHDPFLGNGFLTPGIELPTGAVWRPSLWVFGTNRAAFQYFQDHKTTNSLELVDRLDLFGQLNLTGTERLVFGVRPFDHEVSNQRRYTRYDFTAERYYDGLNFYPQTLFFEGDFGEIFPCLDPFDTKALDYGFSIGRQPVYFQDGMLINADILDAFTVTRNTLYGHGVLNSRVTFMYAQDRVHRNNDLAFYLVDRPAHLVGLFTETDFKVSTVQADVVYVLTSDQTTRDALYFGLSATQRLHLGDHTINNTARVVGSIPVEGETPQTGNGVLLFNELSITPKGGNNLLYCTTFWAIGNYTSAARGVEMGGPRRQRPASSSPVQRLACSRAAMNTLSDDVVGPRRDTSSCG